MEEPDIAAKSDSKQDDRPTDPFYIGFDRGLHSLATGKDKPGHHEESSASAYQRGKHEARKIKNRHSC